MQQYYLYIGVSVVALYIIWRDRRRTKRIRLRYGQHGRVYVLQDVHFPYLYKVGTTHRRSQTRMAEVSATMTCGLPLRLVYEVMVPYAPAIETTAHLRLSRWRHRSERGKEWFKLHGEKGFRRVIREVNRAAGDIRAEGKRQNRWQREADETARFVRYDETGKMVARGRLFL